MFAGKKSAQIREILISESAWEEMTCLFAPSLTVRDVATGQNNDEYWNIRLTYRIEPQVEMASGERNNNPLKFVVTSYVRDKEVKG